MCNILIRSIVSFAEKTKTLIDSHNSFPHICYWRKTNVFVLYDGQWYFLECTKGSNLVEISLQTNHGVSNWEIKLSIGNYFVSFSKIGNGKSVVCSTINYDKWFSFKCIQIAPIRVLYLKVGNSLKNSCAIYLNFCIFFT